MKLLTKEEEQEHYNATLRGGFIGLVGGLTVGAAGVYFGSRRSPVLRSLTLQMKVFLATSAGTFGGIVGADHGSRAYERQRNPLDRELAAREEARATAEKQGKTFTERGLDWARRERYKIVFGSWVASMAAAFALVNRDKYLTGQQKIVQARVYAQFLTLGVLVASAAFEIADRKREAAAAGDPDARKNETFSAGGDKEDRSGADLWKDMVRAEEERLRAQQVDEARFKKPHHHHTPNGKRKQAAGKKEEEEEEEKPDGQQTES